MVIVSPIIINSYIIDVSVWTSVYFRGKWVFSWSPLILQANAVTEPHLYQDCSSTFLFIILHSTTWRYLFRDTVRVVEQPTTNTATYIYTPVFTRGAFLYPNSEGNKSLRYNDSFLIAYICLCIYYNTFFPWTVSVMLQRAKPIPKPRKWKIQEGVQGRSRI